MMSSSTLNPSHLLINRNPPLPAHPQLFSQSTSRHSAASHSVPSFPTDPAVPPLPAGRSSLDHPGNVIQEDNHEYGYEYDYQESDIDVEIHPTFARDSALRGRVKVVVGRNEFWCHKDILWFASPFFKGLLEGE